MSSHLTTPIIVLTGPTGSGKSSLGLEIAKEIDGVIINCDSKQVYKEIPISTAQPSLGDVLDGHMTLEGVDHYLYGYRSVYDPIDLFQYQQDTYNVLADLNKTPILLGGTGLYIDSVIKNFQLKQDFKVDPDLDNKSLKGLQMLAGDLLTQMNESDRKNKHRLIRMIQRGRKYGKGPEREYLYLLVEKEKEELNRSIEQRTRSMFLNGLEDEASRFTEEIKKQDKRFRIIGLQEFREFFLGETNLADVEELINTHTIQYVKKQRTWFSRVENPVKINTTKDAIPQISKFLSRSTSLLSK